MLNNPKDHGMYGKLRKRQQLLLANAFKRIQHQKMNGRHLTVPVHPKTISLISGCGYFRDSVPLKALVLMTPLAGCYNFLYAVSRNVYAKIFFDSLCNDTDGMGTGALSHTRTSGGYT